MKTKILSEPNQQKGFLFLVCATAATIPLPAAFNSVASILLLLFWLLFLPKKWDFARMKPVLLLSSLFWISLAGMIYTQNFDEGVFRIQQKLLLLVYPLVLGTVAWDWKPSRQWIAAAFVITVFAACVYSLSYATVYAVRYQNTTHFFSHPLAASLDFYPYVLALLCLASVLILTEAFIQHKGLPDFFLRPATFFSLILFFSVYLFLLSVVQILLAGFIVAVVYIFRLSRKRQLLWVWMLSLAGVAGVFISLVPSLSTKVNDLVNGKQNTIPLDRDASLGFIAWNGIAMRKAVWACTLDAIKGNPLLGVGTGDGQDELQQAYEKRQFYFASRYNRFNTHNQYLQTVVNFGLIGLATWAVSLFLLFRNLTGHWLAQCLLAVCLFAMLTESMLETNKGILAVAFLLSVFSFPGLHQTPPRA
ncbi:MAG: O-antigen ligase family protein [Bacteroidetes bacterium]|nr:O-antigen ligase family protein [Bacteroidota bacterium]